jgi:hypothetical protein
VNKRFVVVELTAEEELEFMENRSELMRSNRIQNKIPVSVNEVDIDAWFQAFSIAAPYVEDIMNIFYFYEDCKDLMRVD